jgi:hypothetical protein
MKLMTINDIKGLADHKNGLCVSIYMPAHRIHPEQQQDQTRFENALRQSEQMLVERGMRKTQAEQLLRSSRELIEDTNFWRHQDHGLAHFVSKGFMQPYRLPFSPSELVMVGSRFHVKPLMQLVVGDWKYHVIALSQNSVRLFEGNRYEFEPVQIDSLPKSLADALKYDVYEQQLRVHTVASTSQGRAGIMFHGQGIGIDDSKERLLRYFHAVDRGLHEFLHGRHDPLVLAGVEYYLPFYREASTYPFLMNESVTGSADHISEEDLHHKSWEIVEPWFWQEEEKEAERYRQWAGTGMTAGEIAEIIPAAYQGRVESLFVTKDLPQWGVVDPERNRIEIHERQQPGDEDLLDCATLQTILHGGRVWLLESEKIPEHKLAAAVLRY